MKNYTFNQKELENDIVANCGRPYQQCAISVMDTIADPNITFDENGICNYYYEYLAAENHYVKKGEDGLKALAQMVAIIKEKKKGKKYDCILGLSGGVDSTYLCLLAREQGLNPLVVHFDNGWNSELAQHNIEKTIKKCGFDLFTYVINWQEFKAMQLAYFRASVVDIEVLTDHAFMAILYEQAMKWKLKYVLAGMNIVTEQVLPKYWIFTKSDDKNIKDIVNKHGDLRIAEIKTFPFLSYSRKRYYDRFLKLEVFSPLNWVDYNYDSVKKRIVDELDWRDYGGKHYESVWTRFYQGYILPNKFKIDKRKAHFSNLIFSKQITKEEALAKLGKPILSDQLERDDKEFIMKKFGLSDVDFDKIMMMPRKEHSEFEVENGLRSRIKSLFGIKYSLL